MAYMKGDRSVGARERMNQQLTFWFIIQFYRLRNGVIILSCMTRMLRSYKCTIGQKWQPYPCGYTIELLWNHWNIVESININRFSCPWFHNKNWSAKWHVYWYVDLLYVVLSAANALNPSLAQMTSVRSANYEELRRRGREPWPCIEITLFVPLSTLDVGNGYFGFWAAF